MATTRALGGVVLPDPDLLAPLPEAAAERWVNYLYTRPRNPAKPPGLKHHSLALYDPFAKRSDFPAGLRLCANVYVGCPSQCAYCYVRNYVRDSQSPRPKKDFVRQAAADMRELGTLGGPPVPLHISNSTDPFQEALETSHGHTLELMRLVRDNRHLFTTVTFLTKNPLLASQRQYVELLVSLSPCQVEASLIFADERGRQAYEPGAPSIASRQEGIIRLREAQIPVSLRIDPLLPREPLPAEFWRSPWLADYGVEGTHSLGEIESLIGFASKAGCQKIIVSPMKVPVGRYADREFKEKFRKLYAAPFGGRPHTRSFAWRLPERYAQETLIGEVRELCRQHGVPLASCKANLINTP